MEITQVDEEFNAILETYEQFTERKLQEKIQWAAVMRVIKTMRIIAWFCLTLAVITGLAGYHFTAMLNLLMAIMSFWKLRIR